MSSTTFASSDSLTCGILIGQLKKKPRESCQKAVKKMSKPINWQVNRVALLKAPLPRFPRQA